MKALNAVASIFVYRQDIGINAADRGPGLCRIDGPVRAVLGGVVEETG